MPAPGRTRPIVSRAKSSRYPRNTPGTGAVEPAVSVAAPGRESRPLTGPETVVEATVLAAGTVVAGRYEIVAALGTGAMGAVYVARDLRSGAEVAVKVLHAAHARHPTLPSRFAREAQAAAALRHDNCVPVLDAGNDDVVGRFLVMPRLHGRTLGDWMVGPLDVDTTVRWIGALLDGLAHAHAQGFVHRDIKPDNVFVETTDDGLGRIKILDFGLVKMMHARGGRPLTRVGTVFGTPAYMAPEQASGGEVSPQADLYSVGATMYEMLTGYPRLVAERFSEVLMFHAVPPPVELPSSVPSALADFVRALLADEPGHRPASAAAAAATLRHLAARQFRPVSALESAPTMLAVQSRGWELPAAAEPLADPWELSGAYERPATVLRSNRPLMWGVGAIAAGLVAGFVSLFAAGSPLLRSVPEQAALHATVPASPSTLVAEASTAPLDPEPAVRGEAVQPLPMPATGETLAELPPVHLDPVPAPEPAPVTTVTAKPKTEVAAKPKPSAKADPVASEPTTRTRTRTRPSPTPSRPVIAPRPTADDTRMLVARRPPRTSSPTTTPPTSGRVLKSQRPPR